MTNDQLHASPTPDIGSLSISSLKSGYKNLPFIGKEQQFEKVLDVIDKQGFIPEMLIESEAKWFYEQLGIDDVYFARESVDGIVSHIHALYSAKLDAFARNDLNSPFIHHKRESQDHAVYFDTSIPNSQEFKLTNYEKRIDELYLDQLNESYRVESFNAPLILNNEQFDADDKKTVRAHFVYKNQFDSNSIYDQTFLKLISPNTKKLYDEIIEQVLGQTGPLIKHLPVDDSDEHRIIIGYKKNTTKKYFSALSNLINYYKLNQSRKYVENFSNGVTIISIYVKPTTETNPLSIIQLIKEASLLFTIPHGLFDEFFASNELSLQESIYAHIGTIFVTHFLNRLGSEYQSLLTLLDASKSNQVAELLSSLKKRLRSETFTTSFILEVFKKYKSIIQQLFRSFADVHYIPNKLEKTLSYQRLSQLQPIKNEEEFNQLILKNVFNENDALVLRGLFIFNQSILKTNFFTSTKVAISFRLNPDFLPKFEYPETPYGLFFVVGSDFRGFHIRFRDIARGGIRVVKSRSQDAYEVNVRNLFDENYNLASTQQRKNKDIPEGGSKGVILLDLDAQENPKSGFEKYIDSIIDLLIKNDIPGIKEPIVDLYGKPEILFLGPDEGTAGFTDWATLHAKSRGAPWWKSFLTGKSPQLGGIPHDEYGMTSLSVRSYVKKIYETYQLEKTPIKKFQTGGPDGDLGSNEILLSTDNEVYIGIVDGSGVLADPKGLDKDELRRLAHERKMISNYNKSLLSSEGFVVLVDDKDVKLPNEEIISNGVYFRNLFHLNLKKYFGEIDLFVPCGGRPASIDIDNVKDFKNEDGKSIIKYIVEGANLFITQAAKIQLEKSGAVLFKDASTNKGGVTSSSLEVLASLLLSDEQFLNKFKNGTEFYQTYVKQVQATIVSNAEKEATALLKFKAKTGLTLSESSDLLSNEINKLADLISNSKDLWNDESLKFKLLKKSIPELLLKENDYSIEEILKRLPDAYSKSLFSTAIATRYIYEGYDSTNVIQLLEFLKKLGNE
ncbi:glutamate dehydrogenase [Wickerhamomyces ciferrii]|uniref:NAD-specific glutamate dehydrogenase n=1 Tax=Wickerhamomyces ciferrii (strain ATCC 14091 / BCRC 22168 / CBS 111 / JCM 3599 / NBRC 0793 / NRRL Y-1031 F-60-10) TaxID=1206466 RepID=K0KVQ9_WICCF|nr:glutamate dehydrogenase [Wickerhamomyces ciferrii]CCH45574.1 glutamate dehydrogenase [Wickerhamomyces ciferrii]